MRTMIYRIFPSHLYHCLQPPKMVELPDWLSALSVFQNSFQNPWHLIHCLKSWHLIRGYNLTHILQRICFHIRKPSFFKSLASNPNLRKSSESMFFNLSTPRRMRYGSKASYAYPRHSPHTAHRITVPLWASSHSTLCSVCAWLIANA